jgi:hypothetical protein
MAVSTRALLATRPGMPWRFDLGRTVVCGTVEQIAPTDTFLIVLDGAEEKWHLPLAFVKDIRPLSLEQFAEIAVGDR